MKNELKPVGILPIVEAKVSVPAGIVTMSLASRSGGLASCVDCDGNGNDSGCDSGCVCDSGGDSGDCYGGVKK